MARTKKTMDGNTAAAHVSYAFSDVATIYPITPSSTMADVSDKWAAQGRKNIFGNVLDVTELQSEGGAAGALHGALAAGALATTYTASQGLLLMIPNLYKIAGELLPCVVHVSARALATHALSIFGDHSDVYACRQTGCAMLAETNPQEVMDLGAVAHLATLESRVPFINFFDGFRTSHEIQKIETWDYDELAELLDMKYVTEFQENSLNPNKPFQRGTAQNPDIFFQAKEASNPFHEAVPGIVEKYMNKVNAKIGADYKLFNYYGAPDAENLIIAMGSVCDTIEETIDYLNANGGKHGLLKVRLYRPFSVEHFLAEIPSTVKNIAVLDRTKEPGAAGEPLYLDVVAALRGTKFESATVVSGRYGLGSKDTTPGQIAAVYNNLTGEKKPLFTIGIEDDVTHLSLKSVEGLSTVPAGITGCKFWGLGSDGTVGANKNSIKIIGDHTDMYAQAYFEYDSKKSGGITQSHLRFGSSPIKSTYYVRNADFVACHNQSYMDKYDMVQEVKPGGTFLLNTYWTDEEFEEHIPDNVKRYIADNDIQFYAIDGVKLAEEIGLGGRINTILQSAFFKLANIIPVDEAVKYMKEAAKASYGRKGDEIVEMNYKAIDAGVNGARKVNVPDSWKSASTVGIDHTIQTGDPELDKFVNTIQVPANLQKGDTIPVSAFVGTENGQFPSGTSAFEKRMIAVNVPCWESENCIQCNFCSYVCPHAVIRPMVLTEEEAAKAPAGTKLMDMTGMPGYKFGMTVSVMDCTGCGSCANVCPGKKGVKALEMKPIESQLAEEAPFEYNLTIPEKSEVFDKFKVTSVKGSQFKRPLVEFSGACAGCGETPYAKLATQLYGDRMYVANATGCSSIWGGSAPSNPYTKNLDGHGPTWANSLFEDNAEYGFGMYVAQDTIRKQLVRKVTDLQNITSDDALKTTIASYLNTLDDGNANSVATTDLIAALSKEGSDLSKEILRNENYLNKKSVWILGGDGWAYDIGFGGLDHVIASNKNVNILVFDTEVYSNTGGQESKSTPIGAVAQFAATGKPTYKKDLAGMAMTYGYVYVASVAMGADYNQCMKAFVEAENYDGPSIIIAYSPCINHGIRGGMGIAQTEEKRAVAAGYWNLFRYNPMLKAEGKNPFVLDSKAPTASYTEFIESEVRFSSLMKTFPENAKEYVSEAEKHAADRYDYLVRLSNMY